MMTVAGDVASFNQTAYIDRLVAALGGGVRPADVTVRLSPASVLVETRIAQRSRSAGTQTAAALNILTSTEQSLGAALGLIVERADPPTLVELAGGSPAPSSALQNREASANSLVTVLVVVAASLLVGAIITAFIHWHCVSRRRRMVLARPSTPPRSIPAELRFDVAAPSAVSNINEVQLHRVIANDEQWMATAPPHAKGSALRHQYRFAPANSQPAAQRAMSYSTDKAAADYHQNQLGTTRAATYL